MSFLTGILAFGVIILTTTTGAIAAGISGIAGVTSSQGQSRSSQSEKTSVEIGQDWVKGDISFKKLKVLLSPNGYTAELANLG